MGSEPTRKLVDLPILHKFTLYRTLTNYYLIGRDKKQAFWRILKIDRTNPNELNLFEDPTRYTHEEIVQLKKWLSRGNQEYGGLRTETTCYGIIGFVRFLGPYYMLVIKKRKKVGEICGHTVYGVAESQMIMIPNSPSDMTYADSSAERRYKKLLNMVDLSKNFYFSYTYHLMYSLQKNISETERGKIHYETMFVWNKYLTHGIRRKLQNTVWTVALVYGFFQQTKCLVSNEEFILTVIARRSRHYAGTRYLRRGVNDEGSVANEVETEQIVTKEVPEGQKIPMTSVVQLRGSIPLFWSQKPSLFNPQPEIILNNNDRSYVATQHHFENLKQRYGKLIIILNLLKAGNHRENNLREEFRKAIWSINGGIKEDYLLAIHFDLNEHYKSGADRAFENLCDYGKRALKLINLFFCKAPLGMGTDGVINDSFFNSPILNQDEGATRSEQEALKADIFMLQSGVYRSNCIDCLDRTNVAQFANGLVALAHQLQISGIRGPPVVDKNNPLAKKLMEVYQKMGDAIAMQYAGSDAHIRMFSALRGDWNMIKKNRDKIIAFRRYLYNTFQDSEKQNAINVFLGKFKPQLGKPALWKLRSDQQNTMRNSSDLDIKNLRPKLSRSFSDNLVLEGLDRKELLYENPQPSREGLNDGWETTSEVGFYEAESSSSRVHSVIRDEDHLGGTGSRQMFLDFGSTSDYFGLDDIPGFSHSYNATFITAEEMFERCSSTSSDLIIEFPSGPNPPESFSGYVIVPGLSDDFTQWVEYGGALYRVRR
ncbi:Phosphoinositide phosphatase SAC5 [Raphanus sativus]|uniref:Phosphoinositide phosphatase SAC5-like n=1 Tax=Raphanus sativus TaxID=3726 RepID=A0A9W3BXS1_RAPSA|nr:phosphoinositide phosphatase SAC5-like [Raphanus sativus]KAJ4889430.1 Phosphoinositide phosphatase SAC5 [Raphanus sativus]